MLIDEGIALYLARYLATSKQREADTDFGPLLNSREMANIYLATEEAPQHMRGEGIVADEFYDVVLELAAYAKKHLEAAR